MARVSAYKKDIFIRATAPHRASATKNIIVQVPVRRAMAATAIAMIGVIMMATDISKSNKTANAGPISRGQMK